MIKKVRIGQGIVADIRGAAFIEFALVLPFLLVLFIGGLDLARYVYTLQKLNKTVDYIGEYVSSSPTLSEDNMQAYVEALLGGDARAWFLGNTTLAASKKKEVQISGIYKRADTGGNRVMWKQAFESDGKGNFVKKERMKKSAIGKSPMGGGDALRTLTEGLFNGSQDSRKKHEYTDEALASRLTQDGFSAPEGAGAGRLYKGQSIIVVEARVEYKPFLIGKIFSALRKQDIYRRSVFIPRKGTLACLEPGILESLLGLQISSCCFNNFDICADGAQL